MRNCSLSFREFLKVYTSDFLVILAGIWSIHILIYLMVPFRSTLETNYAVLYSGFYVTLCVLGAVITVQLARHLANGRESNAGQTVQKLTSLPGLLPSLAVLSLVGVGLHLYDKIAINHLPYSTCLNEVREAWIRAGVQRGYAISSWQSALGHILSHFSFVLISIVILRQDSIAFMQRVAYASVAIVSIFTYAIAISSRSTLLFFFYTCVLAYVLRRALFPMGVSTLIRRALPIVSVVGIASLGFGAYAFWGRMECGYAAVIGQGVTTVEALRREYIEEYFDDLGIERKANAVTRVLDGDEVAKNSGRPVAVGCATCDLIGMYLTHGLWNFEHALRAARHPGTSFWSFWENIKERLGQGNRASEKESRSYPRGMIALPGAAWYDLGTRGMLGIAVLHGMVITLVGVLIQLGGFFTAIGIVAFFSIGLITLWSPLAFAANVMSFPFIGFAFLVTFLFLAVRNLWMERGWNRS